MAAVQVWPELGMAVDWLWNVISLLHVSFEIANTLGWGYVFGQFGRLLDIYSIAMAKSGKKGSRGKSGGGRAKRSDDFVTAVPVKKSPTRSFLVSALPGIIIAIAAGLWNRRGDSGGTSSNPAAVAPDASTDATDSSPALPPSRRVPSAARKMIHTKKGSWTDGYYTTDPVQAPPATHALLYPNGGSGEPEVKTFTNDEEFLALGRVYNDLGQIVQSPRHFANGTALYRGPEVPGTHFHWPAVHVGYKRPVPGLFGGDGRQVELETLTLPSADHRSTDPRVFYVHNFLSPAEADEFVRFSTSPDNPYKMAPSTGGTHKAWNQGGDSARLTTRTSENAFDVSTKNAQAVKRRAFRLLRMGAYAESLADGIQVLRYEVGQAYVAHHDYFPAAQSGDHGWDPLKGGSNRLATVFLYLSDVERGYGGETAFPNTERLTSEQSEDLVGRLGDPPSAEEQREFVREAGLAEGSWEERLTLSCYAKFAVPPRRGDAILFYSQRPDGRLDASSLHGACPVLKGTKWGANLWVWNACRYSQCKVDPKYPAGELPKEMKAPFPGGV